MTKNKFKLSVVAGMLLTSSAIAGTVTAPNSVNIEISGDVELKMLSEKTGSTEVQKRTAEVNLGLESELKDGLKVVTAFRVYDGTQANSAADTFATTQAYALIPFMETGELKAGLAENDVYGTDAFDNGGESWKLSVKVPVAKDFTATLVSTIADEKENDDNTGDSESTALRIDGKIADYELGAKYTNAYTDKNNAGEVKTNTTSAYVMGSISSVDVSLELASASKSQKGYFLSLGKEFGALNTGLTYVNLSNGLKGGDDFALGMILDGNIDSSTTKDTSAIAIPLEYALNDKLTANAALIEIDNQGNDGREINLGAAYALSDSAELSVAYGKYTQDNADDQTNIELTVAIEF
jgi:hypothetical protein